MKDRIWQLQFKSEQMSGVHTRMMSGIVSEIVEISSTLKASDMSDKSGSPLFDLPINYFLSKIVY